MFGERILSNILGSRAAAQNIFSFYATFRRFRLYL